MHAVQLSFDFVQYLFVYTWTYNFQNSNCIYCERCMNISCFWYSPPISASWLVHTNPPSGLLAPCPLNAACHVHRQHPLPASKGRPLIRSLTLILLSVWLVKSTHIAVCFLLILTVPIPLGCLAPAAPSHWVLGLVGWQVQSLQRPCPSPSC